ncbi:unnamed protein product [Aureobasidium mustum]|uniref:MutL C-terminal dimerisation domain-containing protein n=1 Tax=Aureobasidium mustum TaxID=2773714 RepID=A0A9N8PA17_9PEZI|nr:unnamed protein product [Aureobasidium mustum]
MNTNMKYTSGREPQDTSSAILPLPENVVAQIKSSTTITSLNQVVLGLFENSLDAQATKIDIIIDHGRGGCTVEDNGIGILPSEFRATGGLGRLYHTSKQKESARPENHGGQGTFLASVGALSLLTITSRHAQHYSHNTLILHRSKVISRLTPTLPQHEIRGTTGHGTRVTVRDLFGNMPVRVKQRAIVAEEGAEAERQWQALKIGIVGLLLPWNRRVVVKVTDSEDPARTFFLNTGAQFVPNAFSERNLNALNKKMSGFDQGTVLSILSQSGIISIDSKKSWIPVSASTSSITVKGIISLEPAPSRNAQFMSIGIIPCLDENRHNELYDTVNRLFNQSTFGHIDEDPQPDGAEIKRRQHDRRYRKDGPTNRQLQGGRKGVDRWPRFYFRIDLRSDENPRKMDDLSDMRLRSIANVLESLTLHWLEANNFKPKKSQRKRKQTMNDEQAYHTISDVTSPIPNNQTSSASLHPASGDKSRVTNPGDTSSTDHCSSKRIRSRTLADAAIPTMPFTDWSRIKSARPQMYDSMWKCKARPSTRPTPSDPIKQAKSSLDTPATINVEAVDTNHFGFAHDASHETTELLEPDRSQTALHQDQSGQAYIDWIDPKTNRKHRINARTGIVMRDEVHRPAPSDASTSRSAAAANVRLSSFGRPLVLERRKGHVPTTLDATSYSSTSAPWLEGFLQTWKNPVFETQPEQPIPKISLGGLEQEVGRSHDCHWQHSVADLFPHAGPPDVSRLSKSALAFAQVISQVDNKFILMKTPSLAGSKSQELDHARQLLVLVDQHAASERCILEKLLEELCTPAREIALVQSNIGFTSSVKTVPVDKPLSFQIPLQEETMFTVHAGHFANWGILYDINSHTPEPPRLNILTLPPGISERCKAEPRLLIELLRSEIYTLAESSSIRTRPLEPSDADTNRTWLQRIGSCPKGILQLLNSRACRSAIMFNDVLTLEQCQRLIEEVANCAFPFMCAHGRNSMVPLVHLGGDGGDMQGCVGEFGGREERSQGFASAYRKWREKAAR